MESLPPNWVRRESKSRPGQFYYFNTATGKSSWEVPAGDDNAGGQLREVQVLHLLKKHGGSRRPASWRKDPITCSQEEAVSELSKLRQEIVAAGSGADLRKKFEDLARVESDCSSAKQGGDLGFFGRGQMQKPFEEASFGLSVGELSDIISTDSGVHIILRVA